MLIFKAVDFLAQQFCGPEMATKSEQVVTLDSVRSLGVSADSKKPISWKDLGVYLDKKLEIQPDPDASSKSPSSSLISHRSPDTSYLSLVIKYKICTSCKRPIGEALLSTHYAKCVEMKQKKQDDESSGLKKKRVKNQLLDVEPSSVESSRNSSPLPSTPTNGTKPKKKYKKSNTQKEKEAAAAAAAAALREDMAAGSAEPRKKKQPKAKTAAKPKGPVDVERQCGVPLPSGGFCARSLTCKTHSMGAKRAVLGRSAPYDVLLQQYQKRNQAKLAANNVLAAQRREHAQFEDDNASLNSNNKILDPDEETHLVLEGLSKNYPIPLERKIILPSRNRHKFLYMREAYANALITSDSSQSGSGNQSTDQTLANQAISGSIGGLQGRCALVNVDPNTNNESLNDSITQSFATVLGELYQVRAPSKAILLSAQYNTQQQQAFQQQVLKLQQQQQQQMLLMKQRQASRTSS